MTIRQRLHQPKHQGPGPGKPFAGPLALLSLLLAGCTGSHVPEAPVKGAFAQEAVDLGSRPGPPKGPKGACWQSDLHPAVIETVTEQVLHRPETRGPDGQLLSPAVFTTETRQQMVRDRSTIWFQSPCPAEMTPEFIASLQRALKARGLYLLPVSGQMDAATREALGRFQRARGLDSEKLSLVAAQDLGLVAIARDRLR